MAARPTSCLGTALFLFASTGPAATADTITESDELIVGSLQGLEAWRRDGSGKRMISKGPALHPRWLDAGAVLVLHPNNAGNLAKGGRLERIVLADGTRSRIAKLPPFACTPGTDENRAVTTLEIQDVTCLPSTHPNGPIAFEEQPRA